MTMHNNGMTDAEYFRYNGTLPPDRIEALIDGAVALTALQGTTAHIQEARAQYPDEDFLEGVADIVREVSLSVRGANRAQLQRVLTMLEEIQQGQTHATEYGIDELNKLERLIK